MIKTNPPLRIITAELPLLKLPQGPACLIFFSTTPYPQTLQRAQDFFKNHFSWWGNKETPKVDYEPLSKIWLQKSITASREWQKPRLCCYRDGSKTCLPETIVMCNVADRLLNMFSFGGKLWLCYPGHSENTDWPFWCDLLLLSLLSQLQTLQTYIFPNTIFRLSNLTRGSLALIPTLTLFASSQGANAVLVVVASTYVHVRRYELKI